MSCKALQRLPAGSFAGKHWECREWPDPGLTPVMSSVFLPLVCVAHTVCEGGYSEVGMENAQWGIQVLPSSV